MRYKELDIDRMKKNVRPPHISTGKEEEAWRHYDIANCYSYALGVFEDIDYLRPGEIANMEYKPEYSDEEILERVMRDLEVLGLETTQSSLEEVIEDEYSWKIAIMNVETGEAAVKFIRDVGGENIEAEGMTFWPTEDGAIMHVLDYNKILGVFVHRYKVEF